MTTTLRWLFLLLWMGAGVAVADAETGTPAIPAPHALIIQSQGWASSAAIAADFRVMDAGEALARRAAGEALKAVFVVSREAGTYRVLVVNQGVLAGDAARAERVVGLYERARRWLLAYPQESAALVAESAGVSLAFAQDRLSRVEFQVARPGPALAQALKAGNTPALAATVDALIDDGPMRAATRASEPGRAQALLSLR